ncbi:Pyruvate kinase, barrel domain [Pseudomonas marginalis]|nr:Pyruvate kinase, barrel domain [Pseudomonas marginalis]
MTPDKKVKILATLGPATDGIDDIRELVQAGVNIFRLNFSHGEHADHARRYHWIRQVDEVVPRRWRLPRPRAWRSAGRRGRPTPCV